MACTLYQGANSSQPFLIRAGPPFAQIAKVGAQNQRGACAAQLLNVLCLGLRIRSSPSVEMNGEKKKIVVVALMPDLRSDPKEGRTA